ncbi:MAG: carbohydrate kinase family protein [Nitrososphaeria archaeon]
MKIAVIGDLIMDIKGFYREEIRAGKNILLKNIKKSPGGVAGNTAYYLKMLKDQVFVFGSVGKDPWGDYILEALKNIFVNVDKVKRVNAIPTGFLIVVLDADSERTMIGSRGANEKLEVSQDELLSLHPDWIHLSGYSILNRNGKRILYSVQQAAKKLGINYSVDLEGIETRDLDFSIAQPIIFCNEGFCADKNVKNSKIAIIKAGSKGCYRVYNGEVIQHSAPKVSVEDATAAGDAFNAAFIHAYGKSEDVDFACEFANKIAAKKVTKKGNWVKMPYNKFLMELNRH